MMKKHLKLKIFALVLILLIGFRLYLPVLARHYVNNLLNQDPLYSGHVDDVRIHLWRGAYAAVGFHLERNQGPKRFPLVAADLIDVGISWKDLIRRRIRMKMEIDKLVVNIVQERQAGEKKLAVGTGSKQVDKREAQDWKATFRKLVPIDVDRLAINGESIHYRDLTSSPKVDVFLDQLAVSGRDLTNSETDPNNRFGTVDLHARVMGSGLLHVALKVDPLASPPEFKATTEMNSLQLTRLNDFFTAYGSFDVKSGTLGIYSEMATANGELKGYVKPILKDLSVSDLKKDTKKGGVIHAAWEVIVGAVGGTFKNRSKGQQAARIPFEGRLDDPKVSGWDIAKSVLYNTFIKPISPNIEHSVKMSQLAGHTEEKKKKDKS